MILNILSKANARLILNGIKSNSSILQLRYISNDERKSKRVESDNEEESDNSDNESNEDLPKRSKPDKDEVESLRALINQRNELSQESNSNNDYDSLKREYDDRIHENFYNLQGSWDDESQEELRKELYDNGWMDLYSKYTDAENEYWGISENKSFSSDNESSSNKSGSSSNDDGDDDGDEGVNPSSSQHASGGENNSLGNSSGANTESNNYVSDFIAFIFLQFLNAFSVIFENLSQIFFN